MELPSGSAQGSRLLQHLTHQRGVFIPTDNARMTITIQDEAGIAAMRTACRLAADVLDVIAPHIKPGITTLEIDRLSAEAMAQQGTRSATIGYQPQNYPPYPGHVCTSVNHVVCHGIPSDKKLKKGDIVNVDVTVVTPEGWYGDTSRMFEIGECSIAARRLCVLTYEAMWLGIEQVRPGAYLGDIGHAIQEFAEGHGLSVVREFCGHGIGRKFHTDPQVLHYGKPGTGAELVPGMIFTIEPMINIGRREIKELNDGWTIVTRDHSLSAQWEHTLVVTPTGYEVLSLSPDMPAVPAFVKGAAGLATEG
jgi:methionyl aminopeptidase